MKLAPMNPAPPVTRIMGSYDGRARILSCARCRLEVVAPVPGDEALEPVVERDARSEAGGARNAVDRRVGRAHFAGLERQVLFHCGAAQQRLELGDERLESYRAVVADVVKRIR